ncbi:MAG: single-stranded-DNA-specific exonuclease RecJ [Coriobacteriaceae bacterium]|nr:single-stranded-DNA-specific exonuclease RecJ [Coriobacteriaceae bacterium]
MSTLQSTRRWSVARPHPELEAELSRELDVAPLVARVMAANGISSVREGKLFLTPSLERDWADPLIIPGMPGVVERVCRAVEAGERIAVFGDFDVDGITSTCLLTEGLRALGAVAEPFIPRRFGEGYGISREALDRVIDACAPDLVVTVDNGIAARDETPYLAERGIDLVVTDHHEPGGLVPRDVPLTDPKLSDEGPSRELAGAGVALKLVQALGERLGAPELWRRYTEVAALGTVADMMTLTPENRALVADGIAHMRATARPGYIALAALTRTDLSTVTTDSLSFSLIPRLNAAGRMADPALALELLMATDPIEAGRLAAELEQVNQERRSTEADLTEQALARVAETYDGGRVIVVGGEGWHEGVKGIVASRLTNRYHVPSLLFSIEDGIARGSGRSVGSINLFDAVERCSDLLIRFGGHAGAVGVTCAAENLDALRDRLGAVLAELPKEDFEDTGDISATVSLAELDIDTVRQLSLLEPFGQGNRTPVFAVEGVTMTDRACVGRTGDHLRFSATDGAVCVPAIMFRAPEPAELAACDTVVDLVFEAVAETWAGRTKTKLMIKDILRHGPEGGAGQPARAVPGEGDEVPCCVDGVGEGPAPSAGAEAASRRASLVRLPYTELTRALIHALIGTAEPHAAQMRALDALAGGEDVLAVMGTGRGKSLVFQVHAAREAILNGAASVFVYPLRALVADQAIHLEASLAPLGLKVGVLTGETPADARPRAFAQLASGALDIVLTTPEFLAIHAQRFAAARRVRFVALDEAHHIAGARGGDREAYLDLPSVLRRLGSPRVLACTATATAEAAAAIREVLPAARTVVDDAIRENLAVDDDRDLAARENRLVSIVATGEKCVVYVNSREQSVSLVRMLRRRVPDRARAIAFYNAGLSRADRSRVEGAFRDDELSCIVSTSAFGEGVNLPGIRHVVLYHLPFSATEFNQMSGRAGRDGDPASIHLLYSSRDARINERLLTDLAPERGELVALYRALQTMWRAGTSRTAGGLAATDADLASLAGRIDAAAALPERAVAAALGIFEELGFIRTRHGAAGRLIEVVESPGRVELTESTRYLEGIRARMAFSSFRSWALEASAHDMLARVNRPIVPKSE